MPAGGVLTFSTRLREIEPMEARFLSTELKRGAHVRLEVQDTVKAHQGAIAVHSKPGQGTCFQIWLPLA
jgi:sensor histidine kinase regulating citrate/malate metabolism